MWIQDSCGFRIQLDSGFNWIQDSCGFRIHVDSERSASFVVSFNSLEALSAFVVSLNSLEALSAFVVSLNSLEALSLPQGRSKFRSPTDARLECKDTSGVFIHTRPPDGTKGSDVERFEILAPEGNAGDSFRRHLDLQQEFTLRAVALDRATTADSYPEPALFIDSQAVRNAL
jgi:hypothetical protein